MDKVVILDDYRSKSQSIKNEETLLSINEKLRIINSLTDEETKKSLEMIGKYVDRHYPE